MESKPAAKATVKKRTSGAVKNGAAQPPAAQSPKFVEFTAYCVKCGAQRTTQKGQHVVNEHGNAVIQGPCPECGAKLTKFNGEQAAAMPGEVTVTKAAVQVKPTYTIEDVMKPIGNILRDAEIVLRHEDGVWLFIKYPKDAPEGQSRYVLVGADPHGARPALLGKAFPFTNAGFRDALDWVKEQFSD